MDALPLPRLDMRELQVLRKLARIACIGAWEYDPVARELYWTEQVYRILELEPYSVTPTLDAAVGYYAPEARATIAHAMQSALERGEAWDLELPSITARGRRIWVRVIGEPEMADGRCIRLAGTIEDVTAGRRAREALKARSAENRRLALVAEHTSNLVLITGADNRIQWVNASFTRVTGYAPAEAIGHTPFGLLCRGDGASDPRLTVLRETMLHGEAVRGWQVELTRKDGSRYWAEIEIHPVFDESGATVNYIHIQNDVTDKRVAEQQALAATESLALAISATGLGFAYRDLDQDEPVWDPQVYRIHGFAPGEPVPPIEAQHALILREDRPAFLAALEALRASAGPVEVEYRIRRRDGAVRWIRSRSAVVRLDPQRAPRIVAALLDITEIKQAQQAQRLLAERLELTNSAAEVGIFERAPDKQPGFWNAQMFRLWGAPLQQAAPAWDWLLARVEPEDRALFESHWERIKQSADYVDTEFRIRRPDGTRAWLLTRARLAPGDGVQPPRVVGITIDVTQRKEAEQRAAQAAQLLQLASQAVGVGFGYRELASDRCTWDAKACAILGLPPQASAQTVDEFVQRADERDRARVAALCAQPLTAELHGEVEFGVHLPDGGTRRVLLRCAAHRDERGQPERIYAAVIDVTASRESEARLRDALERLRMAAEAGGVASWERNLDSGEGRWDAAMFAFHGLPVAAVAPAFDLELALVHPDDRATIADAWKRMAGTDEAVEWEYRIVRRDGSLVHLASRGRAQRNADGKPWRVIGVALDVTASRRTAQQLQDALARLRLSTEVAAIGIWERDPGGAGRWDPMMFRLYGLPPGEVPTLEQAIARVHPEDRPGVLEAWRRIRETDGTVELNCRVVRPDGSVVHMNTRARAMRSADGRIERVIGASIDVTATLTAQLRLEEIGKRLQLAAAATGIGFWWQALDGTSVDADRQLKLLYGFDPDEPAPSSEAFLATVLPEDRPIVLAARTRAVCSDEPVESEYRIVHPLKGVRHMLTRRALQRDAAGQPLHVFGAAIDVTDARRAEAALRSANERLELATRTAGIGVWEYAPGEERFTWDARMYELYGQPPDWIPTHAAWLALVHPDDRARVAQRFGDDPPAADGGQTEYRIVRPDGEQRIIAERFVVRRDAAGRATHLLGTNIDVTNIRRVQRERDDLSSRLRLVTASVGMGLWVWDLVSGASVWDDAMYALFGATRESFRDRIWLDAVHPDDRTRAAAAVRAARDGFAPLDIEFRVVWPDGSVHHLASRGRVERDAAGVPVRMVGVNWDVTDSRAAQQRALDLAERLKLATQAAGLAVWHIDGRTRRMEADESLCRMHGVPPGPHEDLWAVLEATIAPEDLPALKEASVRARLEKTPFEAEYRTIHPDGSVRHLAVRGIHQRDESGEPIRMYGVTFDITALRAAEQTASALLERMRMTTGAVGIGLWEVDLSSGAVSWDDQMCRLYGRTRDELGDLARQWDTFVHPDDRDRVRRESLRTLDPGQPLDFEVRALLPDGSQRHLAHRVQTERDTEGRAVRLLGVAWDVTERRTAEAALLAKEAAERASRAKSEFLSRMSHELRTPLNAIIGFTQVLALDRSYPLAPAQRDRLDKIQQAGWHLLNLINEILDLSRIEAGALPLSMAIVPLGEVVDECISLVAADAQRRALAIGQTRTPRAPASVRADRTRLKQVLLNLLSNAVKYNRDGGRIDVDVDADAEGRALITVRDTGPGLAPAQIEKLFEPFNRLGMESTAIEGTGIGLTIALRLVEQMGGELTVSSEPGAGSAFRVALPAASTTRDEAADILQTIAPASVQPREDVRGSVLYVEDNPSNVAVVEQLLALRPNVKLFTAGDGASARVMAAVCQPDLILLDMRLPDTDGLTLFAELRARPETKSIPCIGVSANAMPADVARARAAGFADYWTKPIEAGPFLRGIDAALTRQC